VTWCLIRLAGFHLYSFPNGEFVLLGALSASVATLGLYGLILRRRLEARRAQLIDTHHRSLVHLQKYYDQLIDLHKVSRTLASKTTPATLFNRIAQICFEIFDCERVSIMVVDADKHELEVKAAVGHGDMNLVLGARQGIGDGVAGWVAEHRRPLLLGPQINVEKFWRFKPKNEVIFSSMAVPVMFREKLYGVLCVSSRTQEIFYSQDDLRIVEVMAWNAAVSIRHVELLGVTLGSLAERGSRNPEPSEDAGDEPERKTA
jgi:transcriptional regulator with GAF, ATPase, and Fis domain